MILLDFNGVIISGLVASHMREKIDINNASIAKHIAISSVRNINLALANNYGEMILCVDSRSWRKDSFDYYKANRDKNKEESTIDWDVIFSVMTDLQNDFNEFFPFHVVKKENCEADDLIAAFVKETPKEIPIAIVSKDKDFNQLVRGNVKQYNPQNKKFIDVPDPDYTRIKHFISGDTGDGVPNVLSDDDTLVNDSKRQATLTEKRLNFLVDCAKNNFKNVSADKVKSICTKTFSITPRELKRNWDRNKLMIDLAEPCAYAINAVHKYKKEKPELPDKIELANYFMRNKMVTLMSKVGDFYSGATKEQKTNSIKKHL